MFVLRFLHPFKFILICLFFVLTAFFSVAIASDDEEMSESAVPVQEKAEDNSIPGLDLTEIIRFCEGKDLKTYHEDRQNALDILKADQFEQFAALVDDDEAVGVLLLQQDSVGKFAVTDFIVEATTISPRLVKILTTPRSDKKDTLLMALAMRDYHVGKKLKALKAKGIDISQKDIYGNTVTSIDENLRNSLSISDFIALSNPQAKHYSQQKLNEQLWMDIQIDPYAAYIRKLWNSQRTSMNPSDFAAIALRAVQNQYPTPVHHAFLFRDSLFYLDSDVEKAAALWESFFRAYDSLLKPSDREEQQKFSLNSRVVKVVSEHIDNAELQQAVVQLINGTSWLGVQFREVNEDADKLETEIYVLGVRNYILHLETKTDEVFEGKDSLLINTFYPTSLHEETETLDQLRWHQLKYTVVALYALNRLDDHSVGSKRQRELNDDEIFSYIDGIFPTLKIDSKAIFHGVKSRLPAGSDALDF
ncbi:MAG: hypothetical protein K2Q34_07085 [Alphaproteobacteria bacterium]|nr:hypothetical protein [Alphaproteobacteria bacterium]